MDDGVAPVFVAPQDPLDDEGLVVQSIVPGKLQLSVMEVLSVKE